MQTVIELAAEIDVLPLRLNNDKVSKKILERKVSEQSITLKAMTASLRKLKKGTLGTKRD